MRIDMLRTKSREMVGKEAAVHHHKGKYKT